MRINCSCRTGTVSLLQRTQCRFLGQIFVSFALDQRQSERCRQLEGGQARSARDRLIKHEVVMGGGARVLAVEWYRVRWVSNAHTTRERSQLPTKNNTYVSHISLAHCQIKNEMCTVRSSWDQLRVDCRREGRGSVGSGRWLGFERAKQRKQHKRRAQRHPHLIIKQHQRPPSRQLLLLLPSLSPFSLFLFFYPIVSSFPSPVPPSLPPCNKTPLLRLPPPI